MVLLIISIILTLILGVAFLFTPVSWGAAGVLFIVSLALTILAGFVYKSHVEMNKKLQDSESTVHLSTPSGEGVGKVLSVIVVVIFMFSAMSGITGIRDDIEEHETYMQNRIASLEWKIDELESRLKKQDSVISDFKYYLGKVDSTEHTVETTFSCILKSESFDTTVSLRISDKIINLEKGRDGIYEAVQRLSIFKDYGEISVSVTTNGITTTENLDDYIVDTPFCFSFLPHLIDINDTLEHSYGDKSFTTEGVYYVGLIEEFSDIKMIFSVNDKVVDSIQINTAETRIDKEIAIESGDKVDVYVEGTDKYGYIHRFHSISQSSEDPGTSYPYEIIMDSEGNVLCNNFI